MNEDKKRNNPSEEMLILDDGWEKLLEDKAKNGHKLPVVDDDEDTETL